MWQNVAAYFQLREDKQKSAERKLIEKEIREGKLKVKRIKRNQFNFHLFINLPKKRNVFLVYGPRTNAVVTISNHVLGFLKA